MAHKENPLTPSIMENIAKVIGDTNNGYTGSEIMYNLSLNNIPDPSSPNEKLTKWVRIYNAFVNYQNIHHCSNDILKFIKEYFAPNRFVNKLGLFNEQREEVNLQLRFCGYEITEEGYIIKIQSATTISEAQSRADSFKQKLHNQNAHHSVIYYAKSELMVNDYFHSVLESIKGLYQRIRDLSGSSLDGAKLIQAAFYNDPAIIINNYVTQSDKDEHRGFSDILQGLNSLVRNPQSHTARIDASFSEQDAIEIFALISYCHRKLDNCNVIKQLS